MRGLFLQILSCLISCCLCSKDFVLDQSTLLQGDTNVYMTAFGDFNGDQQCDIFTIGENAQSVDLFMAQKDMNYIRQGPMITVSGPRVISSIMLSDFDGDIQLDVLITIRDMSDKKGPLTTVIYWGNQTHLQDPYHFEGTMRDEPLLFDYNGDMLTDLLAETEAVHRYVWQSNKNRTFDKIEFTTSNLTEVDAFAFPSSNAFVDINGDLTPDLVLTTIAGFEIWLNMAGVFEFNDSYSFPDNLPYRGLSAFVDIDQDNRIEHILPGCDKADCSEQSSVWIYDYHLNKWSPLFQTPAEDDQGFVDPSGSHGLNAHTNFSIPLSLHFGDYNMDGYPDALVIFETKKKTPQKQRAVLLANGACMEPDCGDKRSLVIKDFVNEDQIADGVVLSAFFDMYEDGKLDVLLVIMNETKQVWSPQLILMKNNLAEDASFLKVTVLSGLCDTECPGGHEPYGVNCPGPTSKFNSVRPDGGPQQSTATQLSQSSHFALQTPYVVFGLGQTPNFVDDLAVGIPQAPKPAPLRHRVWHTIIPNSQLVIIPYPINLPSRWSMKLFVTASHLVYITGACLLGTCGFVAIIVCILQWREKREDKLEKKQEAQKFHFDAM